MAKRKKKVARRERKTGKRSCLRFKLVKIAKGKTGTGKGFRCVEFKDGKTHPNCTPGSLRGGGRSQKHIRPGGGSCVRVGSRG